MQAAVDVREAGADILIMARTDANATEGFDEALELLYMGGYSLPEAMLMMIPEPWENHEEMPEDLKAFYDRYYTPDAMTLVIVGDVDSEQALEVAEARLAEILSRADVGGFLRA